MTPYNKFDNFYGISEETICRVKIMWLVFILYDMIREPINNFCRYTYYTVVFIAAILAYPQELEMP